MALKLNIPFPIFAPQLPPGHHPYVKPNPNPNPPHQRGPSEVRFSRWNNANARRFEDRRRTQEEIETDIRRHRRFEAATKIAQTHDSSAVENPKEEEATTFKSRGTPSLPSAPSIPGRRSKYSKPEVPPKPKNKPQVPESTPQLDSKPTVKVSQDGVSYVIDGAPFEFRYSYTEAPKVKPLKMREPYAPFGPTTMGRPWTGRPPLPASRKQLKEFDSFQLPPPDKKGVKPVQKPGPYLPGSGPRYVYKREEILGEPLTREEIRDLVKGCIKTRRQLNIGRDGLTHNMLDNIHAHWKRRRVCKIKCKGVCTVDMDNVCQQLEERTGGKVIYRKGGVLFLFRGRNYNYRTRPRFPLMLWKPVSPVYPRLIKRVPEGLTLEEATEMRKKGRNLIPICKLAKNGVYCDLVKNVKEAFQVCELVRINCQGIKGSDYKKIGAKLKDLVPCVLISFENEHLLIWRGRDWKSSLPVIDKNDNYISDVEDDDAISLTPPSENQVMSNQIPETDDEAHHSYSGSIDEQKDQIIYDQTSGEELSRSANTYLVSEPSFVPPTLEGNNGDKSFLGISGSLNRSELILDASGPEEGASDSPVDDQQPFDPSESPEDIGKPENQLCMEKVLSLMNQAVEDGSALVLDDSDLDADIVFKKAVVFAKTAPQGPVFQLPRRKPTVRKVEKQERSREDSDLLVKDDYLEAPTRVEKQKQASRKRMDYLDRDYMDVLPQGSLKVDELAKLLS